MKLMRTLGILGCFLLSTYAARGQNFTPACGSLRVQSIYHVPPNSTVPYYRIVAYTQNRSETSAAGYVLHIPALASDPRVISFASAPTLLKKLQSEYFVTVAMSTAPMVAVSNPSGVAYNISNYPFTRENFKFKICPDATSIDALFETKANCRYHFARSPNLTTPNWEVTEELTATTNAMVWRPLSMLRSDPAPAREFYRIGADCTDAADDLAEAERLDVSIKKLRAEYELNGI